MSHVLGPDATTDPHTRSETLGTGPGPHATANVMLVRHGESVANARHLFTGVIDVGLTPAGEQECVLAGQRLAGTGWIPDVICTSELVRGWRTAELMRTAWPSSVPVARDWRLNERNYGALSGFRKSEIAERFGHERFIHWRRSLEGRPPPLAPGTLALWRTLSPFDVLPPEALTATESLADVVARVRPWVREILGGHVAAGRRVLLVAHGNSLRAVCAVLDRLDGAELAALNLPNARPLAYRLRTPTGGLPESQVRGGDYLDPGAARAEAAAIAAEGGT
ncbi:2,3-diphosphoglycerate-dependent phosphoglycerate mutase [Occultella glacieicola]|uniref:2,3-bisphosphoglycerate-dependent phosphoglycerate mutase n=1 Tax=Occultella glacieicola TaxID=2518684 RepID=A0ABY2E8I9_9MICO|nr:2,3-diphosphoglycerate-dependent phosphoglycerate mutase [Occultella glacieicola]TDE98701.1 2,3-diphosphoglycerate-dependent phosphoglycerate mutase [Occultella glacieicola]